MKRAIAMHRAQRARSNGVDETAKPTERVGLVQHWGGAPPPLGLDWIWVLALEKLFGMSKRKKI